MTNNDEDQLPEKGNNIDHSYQELQQGYSWMDQTSPKSSDGGLNVDPHAPSQYANFSPKLRNPHGNLNYRTSNSPLNSSLPKSLSTSSMYPNTSPRNSIGGGSGLGSGVNVNSSSYRSNSWSGLEARHAGVDKSPVKSTFSSFFQISIPSSSTEQDSAGSYTSYNICIKTQFSMIEVKRRHGHFTQLHQGLVERLPDVPLPPLPSQRRYSTAVENLASSDRQSLQDYLQHLGSLPKVWQCSHFIDFMDCRHPLLGLQIQYSALKDDCVSYRSENEILARKVCSLNDVLLSVTQSVEHLQQQVGALEQQFPQRRLSTPRSQASGSPHSTHSHSQLTQSRTFHNHGHNDHIHASNRLAVDDEKQFSIPSRSPSSNHAPGPMSRINEFDTVSWPLGLQEVSPTPDRRLVTPSMRLPGGRKEISLSDSPHTPTSLLCDDFSRSVQELESPIDEESFSNFFGLEMESTLESLETKLQPLSENSPPASNHSVSNISNASEPTPAKITRITSLLNDSNSVISAYLPSEVIQSTMMSPSLLHFSNDILRIILPTTEQLLYRYNIEKYISKLVRKSLGAQLYQTGLNSLNCFLPDDPIFLSVYLCRGLEHSWYVRLNEKLCRMASGGGTVTEQTEEDEDKPEGESVSTSKHNLSSPPSPQPESKIKIMRGLSASVESEHSLQPNSGSSSQPITNVNVISNDVESILQCVVGKTRVDIHANMKIDLCFAAFLEEVDRSIGHDHLFKKSLTLVRAWWIYESPKHADNDLFKPDIIPVTAICIMVCAVFNLHTEAVKSPVHALLLFLAEFSEFDWRVYALTIFGRVRRNLIEALPYSSFIKKNGSLFSAPIIQRYQKVLHGTSSDIFDKVQQPSHEMPAPSPRSAIFTLFERIEEHDDAPNSISENAEYVGSSEIKIYHPLEPNVNVISESILPTSSETFLKIMQEGATRMKEILLRSGNPETTMSEDLRDFFSATLNRFESGWRPDTLSGRDNENDEDEVGDILLSSIGHNSSNMDFTGVLGTGENKPKKPSGPGDTPLGGGTEASDQEYLKDLGDDFLLISLDYLTEKIKHCNFLLEAQVTEPVLQRMSKEILQERGPLPVGEIGKMLQEITKISTLSAYLKEKYGGLKKFLELFEQDFVISVDHPFNPHVFLRHTLQPEDIASINSGAIPIHLSTKANKRRLSRRKRLTSQGSSSSDVGSAFQLGGNGHMERSLSMGGAYERNNSVTSRNSYTSQHSYGHTSASSRSATPTMASSFYGYSNASGSYSPPDTGNGQVYLGHHQHLNLQQMSNSSSYSNHAHGDRRRASHVNEGYSDRYVSESENEYKRPPNRKTIPNQNFNVEYQRDGSHYEGYLDDSGRVRQSSGRRIGPPTHGAYIPHEQVQGWR